MNEGRLVITVDDPRSPELAAIVERHLSFAREVTPPELVFAFDLDRLVDPSVTFVGARLGGEVVGMGALKVLEPGHGELKSMHTVAEVRRLGVARAIVEHLLDVAVGLGLSRVSLETGTQPEFEPARRLYARLGFRPCPPFGPYDERSACMTFDLPHS